MQVVQVLQEAQELSSAAAWAPLLHTIVGGLLALLGGLVATWYAARVARRQAAESLRSAFSGEVSAFVQIVETSDYARQLGDALKLDDNFEPNSKPLMDAPPFPLGKLQFPLYESNASSIGQLGPELAGDVSRFYTQAYAVLATVEGWKGQVLTGEPSMRSVGAIYKPAVEAHRKLLVETLDLGKALITKLNDEGESGSRERHLVPSWCQTGYQNMGVSANVSLLAHAAKR